MSDVTPRSGNDQGYNQDNGTENQSQDSMRQGSVATNTIKQGQRRKPLTPPPKQRGGATQPAISAQPTMPPQPRPMSNGTVLEPIEQQPSPMSDRAPIQDYRPQPQMAQPQPSQPQANQIQPQPPAQPQTAPQGGETVKDDSRPMNAMSNKVNIAQILKDFRNTISAIGTPDILREEVEDYLKEVEEHTKGEAPSIAFVQTNLLNGAMVLDKYISETLNKESKVVVKWLEALFLQRINYRFNDEEVNKAFLVKFPESKEEKERKAQAEQQAIREEQAAQNTYEPIEQTRPQPVQQAPVQQPTQVQPTARPVQHSNYAQHSSPIQRVVPSAKAPMPKKSGLANVFKQAKVEQPQKKKAPELKIIPEDMELKSLFIQAKKHVFAKNPSKAMDMFYRALTRAEQINDAETQSKICLEMGKIYDDNNYIVQALGSYNKSLKTTTDISTKTVAHYSMAQIYDNVEQVEPAIAHYLTSVSYAGEADNLVSQSTSLTKIGNIFTRREDEQAFEFYGEASVLVEQTDDSRTKGYVSCNMANAYDRFQKPDKALGYYADAIKNYSDAKLVENVAENYKKAGELMLTLNNPAKAKVLLRKALIHADRVKDSDLIVEINQKIRDIAA